ncbi:MAG: MGH1-like glycoside hydrolase domain-containing protein, partial [Nostoc sp.]
TGGYLEQSDGTSWMAMYALNLLKIALELAQHNYVYEDIASKFFEHYIGIIDAMNTLGGSGLWDEEEGFFFDQLTSKSEAPRPLKVRSIVGLVPLYAIGVL